MTAGNLSRHVTILEEAGLIDVEKGYEGKRPRTWITINPAGRRALAAEWRPCGSWCRRSSARG